MVPESDKKAQVMGILPSERTQNVVTEKHFPLIDVGFDGALGEALHETESEFREGLHETTSEFDENRRESLHEITSELAERVAERLLEGLRRAAAVR